MSTVRYDFRILICFATTFLLVVSARAQTTWFVDDDAPGGGDGLSWNTAFSDLQAALDIAVAGDEIRVAGGTYVPSVRFEPTIPRTETFFLFEGIAVRGGFAGLANPALPDLVDPRAYESILSGDLNGDDGSTGSLSDNSYHVVTASGLSGGTVLGGFTITGGNARAALPYGLGGGMYVSGGNPRIENCHFLRNKAYYGAGIYTNAAAPSLLGCVFSGNDALVGGGVFAHQASSPELYNCRLAGNNALYGGGVCAYGHGAVTLGNCTLVGNNAYFGGAIFNYDSSLSEATNCILWGNTWNTMDRDSSSAEAVSFCAVTNGWTGMGNIGQDPRLLRLPYHGADQAWGTADDDYGDLHLTPGSPCIDAGDNAGLPPHLFCDCVGNARYSDDPDTPDTGVGDPPIIDMGAYEYIDCNGNGVSDDIDLFENTSFDCNENRIPDECDIAGGFSQDLNGNGIPDECEGADCPGDLNGDNLRNLDDLAQLLGHYGQSGVGYTQGDLTGDGIVNLDDLAAMLAVYGVPCP